MERLYKIRKGLDLNLKGEAAMKMQPLELAETYAISPTDFTGVVPRLSVKEGEHVQAGDALFIDKATERIKFVSPVSGEVVAIVRGERRKLLDIVIKADKQQSYKEFGAVDADAMNGEDVLNLLLESGLFAFFMQRPYDVVASPADKPKAIFVSAFSKMPLAADFSFVVKGHEGAFKSGLNLLSKLAKVHLGICPEQEGASFIPTKNVEVSVFSGPNPAGNVGVQINHVSPVNKGEVVWTLDPNVVVMIGHLLETGHVDLTRRVAVAGSLVSAPQYVETKIGTPLKHVLKGLADVSNAHARIINGNPLTGRKATMDDFVGGHTSEITVIPEGDNVDEMLGWILPRTNDFSVSRSYFSWLFGKNKEYALDARVKGGERHMIMSGEYDKVLPMDIYAEYLIKAIIAGDIDRMEQLGIYEVAPEDFAVAEFVDSSKLELQHIVRQGLDMLRKENA